MNKLSRILKEYEDKYHKLQEETELGILETIKSSLKYIYKSNVSMKGDIDREYDEMDGHSLYINGEFTIKDSIYIERIEYHFGNGNNEIGDEIYLVSDTDDQMMMDKLSLDEIIVFAKYVTDVLLPQVQEEHKVRVSKKLNEKNIIDFKSFYR